MAKTLKCKCCSSYTWPAYIWATLSILAAFMCPFGLYFSNWLVARQEDGTYNSVSSFRVCLNETSRISFSCDSYLMFDGIYSSYWQAVTLLMGIGTCFIVLVALTSIFGFFVRKLFNPVVVAITGSFQALGGEQLAMTWCLQLCLLLLLVMNAILCLYSELYIYLDNSIPPLSKLCSTSFCIIMQCSHLSKHAVDTDSLHVGLLYTTHQLQCAYLNSHAVKNFFLYYKGSR